MLALLAVAACKDKRETVSVASAPVVAEASAPVLPDAVVFTGDVDDICATAKQLMDRAIPCAPRSADKLRETKAILDYGITAGGLDHAPLSARERWAAGCAETAKAYDDKLAVADPACRLTADERLRNDTFLAAYYGRRTMPRATGNVDIDKSLAELAAARDALCACTDEECVRAARNVVTDAIKPIPREMAQAMEDGVAISDEVSRCAQRIESTHRAEDVR